MESSSESLKSRVEAVLDMALSTICSLSELFISGTGIYHEDSSPMELSENFPKQRPAEDAIMSVAFEEQPASGEAKGEDSDALEVHG